MFPSRGDKYISLGFLLPVNYLRSHVSLYHHHNRPYKGKIGNLFELFDNIFDFCPQSKFVTKDENFLKYIFANKILVFLLQK